MLLYKFEPAFNIKITNISSNQGFTRMRVFKVIIRIMKQFGILTVSVAIFLTHISLKLIELIFIELLARISFYFYPTKKN